jgi:mRNA-degrading endonuclease RelE of RelBE toxin-antitoxin system
LEAPQAAQNIMKELIAKINYLMETPFARPLVHGDFFASKGIRSIKVKNYILFYSVDEEVKTVFLHRFMYNRRDWMRILSDDWEGE